MATTEGVMEHAGLGIARGGVSYDQKSRNSRQLARIEFIEARSAPWVATQKTIFGTKASFERS